MRRVVLVEAAASEPRTPVADVDLRAPLVFGVRLHLKPRQAHLHRQTQEQRRAAVSVVTATTTTNTNTNTTTTSTCLLVTPPDTRGEGSRSIPNLKSGLHLLSAALSTAAPISAAAPHRCRTALGESRMPTSEAAPLRGLGFFHAKVASMGVPITPPRRMLPTNAYPRLLLYWSPLLPCQTSPSP